MKCGDNFRILKKIYFNRQGQRKLKTFEKEVLTPLGQVTDGVIEISDDNAMNLVKQRYPEWLERYRLDTWQEVVNRTEYARLYDNLYTSYDAMHMCDYIDEQYNGKRQE